MGDGAVPGSNARVLGDTRLQTAVLEENAGAVRYHAWLASLALPYLGEHPFELGSGLGGYVERWLEDGVPRVTASEADPQRLAFLQERFGSDDRVDVIAVDLDHPPSGEWSAFVSFNVLEHIPDDVACLRAAGSMVRRGAPVVTFAPAFPSAYSQFDARIGHVRRYTRSSISAAYVASGLRLGEVRYVNMPGLAAWFVGMRVLGMTPGDGPVLRLWDSVVVPATRALENRTVAPFGQSVLAVGYRE